jgi:hypothetical protein
MTMYGAQNLVNGTATGTFVVNWNSYHQSFPNLSTWVLLFLIHPKVNRAKNSVFVIFDQITRLVRKSDKGFTYSSRKLPTCSSNILLDLFERANWIFSIINACFFSHYISLEFTEFLIEEIAVTSIAIWAAINNERTLSESYFIQCFQGFPTSFRQPVLHIPPKILDISWFCYRFSRNRLCIRWSTRGIDRIIQVSSILMTTITIRCRL